MARLLLDLVRAARIYAVHCVATAFFQCLLAAGMPWGALACGGHYSGVLSEKLRWASAAAVFLLTFLALIVLSVAGLALRRRQGIARRLLLLVVAFSNLPGHTGMSRK